jgi:hypothetical protein
MPQGNHSDMCPKSTAGVKQRNILPKKKRKKKHEHRAEPQKCATIVAIRVTLT